MNSEADDCWFVQFAPENGLDTICVLGDPDVEGADADGTGELLVLQFDDNSSWIGFCRAFAASPMTQLTLLPVDPAEDHHLVVNVAGRFERRAGRPATDLEFGYRLAAAAMVAAAA